MRCSRWVGLFSLCAAVLVVTAWAWGKEASADEGGGAGHGDRTAPEPSYAPHTPKFPRHFFTDLPFEVGNAFNSDPDFTQWPWECDPEYMHDTGATPSEYEYLGEFDLTNGVLLAMPEWGFGCFMSDQRALIRASLETDAQVTILTDRHLIPNLKRCLRGHGFTEAQIERINFAPVEVDSVWIRDFGPEFQTHREDGSRAMVDPTYAPTLPRPDNCRPLERGPLTFGRSRDDVSPTRLAELMGRGHVELDGVQAQPEVFRPPLVFEGGNIFTDGDGTCFRNRRATNRLNTKEWFWTASFYADESTDGWWDHTEGEINNLISEYYNCEVVVLESMRPTAGETTGGVIDHIDMSVTFLSSDTVLVGDYDYETEGGESLTLPDDRPDDPINAEILDSNASKLAELGYNVVRIPMPVPHCTRGGNCAPDYDRDLSGDTIIPCPDFVSDEEGRFVGGVDPDTGEPIGRNWATFANSIRIGDSLMMPSYQATAEALPDEREELLKAQEEEARKVYQRELDRLYGDGAVEVVPVPSDGLAPCNGSLQCITKTY